MYDTHYITRYIQVYVLCLRDGRTNENPLMAANTADAAAAAKTAVYINPFSYSNIYIYTQKCAKTIYSSRRVACVCVSVCELKGSENISNS